MHFAKPMVSTEKRMCSLKVNTLSFACRVTLTKSILQALPLFHAKHAPSERDMPSIGENAKIWFIWSVEIRKS